MVNQLRDAVELRSERGRVEADDGATRSEVLLPFGQDVGSGKLFAFAQRQRVSLLETFGQFFQVEVDQRGRRRIHSAKNTRVGKRSLKAFKVQAWTVDAERSGTFVFVMKDSPWKQFDEVGNVFVVMWSRS